LFALGVGPNIVSVTNFGSIRPSNNAAMDSPGVIPCGFGVECNAFLLHDDLAFLGRYRDDLVLGLRLLGVQARAFVVDDRGDGPGDRQRYHREQDGEHVDKSLDSVTKPHQRIATKGPKPPTVSQANCESFHDDSLCHKAACIGSDTLIVGNGDQVS
jgi:hypothetical protein